MTDERLDTLDKMFKSNQIAASKRGYEGLSINSFATILTVEQLLEERDERAKARFRKAAKAKAESEVRKICGWHRK